MYDIEKQKTGIMLIMGKSVKKLSAYTLTEMLFTLILFGIIAMITIPNLIMDNPAKRGWDTLSQKMTEYLTQASSQILLNHSGYDDFTRIKYQDTHFSIEDANITDKMAALYKNYLVNVDLNVDMTKEYFDKPLIDFEKNSIGYNLRNSYSNFFYVNDGMLIGFRFYGGCNNTEQHSNPPTFRKTYPVQNVCGSIFYDINAYAKPNKLGSDQYIVAIGKRGIKYENY